MPYYKRYRKKNRNNDQWIELKGDEHIQINNATQVSRDAGDPIQVGKGMPGVTTYVINNYQNRKFWKMNIGRQLLNNYNIAKIYKVTIEVANISSTWCEYDPIYYIKSLAKWQNDYFQMLWQGLSGDYGGVPPGQIRINNGVDFASAYFTVPGAEAEIVTNTLLPANPFKISKLNIPIPPPLPDDLQVATGKYSAISTNNNLPIYAYVDWTDSFAQLQNRNGQASGIWAYPEIKDKGKIIYPGQKRRFTTKIPLWNAFDINCSANDMRTFLDNQIQTQTKTLTQFVFAQQTIHRGNQNFTIYIYNPSERKDFVEEGQEGLDVDSMSVQVNISCTLKVKLEDPVFTI